MTILIHFVKQSLDLIQNLNVSIGEYAYAIINNNCHARLRFAVQAFI